MKIEPPTNTVLLALALTPIFYCVWNMWLQKHVPTQPPITVGQTMLLAWAVASLKDMVRQ